jgi:hypothetical protein
MSIEFIRINTIVTKFIRINSIIIRINFIHNKVHKGYPQESAHLWFGLCIKL